MMATQPASMLEQLEALNQGIRTGSKERVSEKRATLLKSLAELRNISWWTWTPTPEEKAAWRARVSEVEAAVVELEEEFSRAHNTKHAALLELQASLKELEGLKTTLGEGGAANAALGPWKPDSARSACAGCGSGFSVFNRKHHCRSCGDIFDKKCSDQTRPVPCFGYTEPVRVCKACFALKPPAAKKKGLSDITNRAGSSASSTNPVNKRLHHLRGGLRKQPNFLGEIGVGSAAKLKKATPADRGCMSPSPAKSLVKELQDSMRKRRSRIAHSPDRIERAVESSRAAKRARLGSDAAHALMPRKGSIAELLKQPDLAAAAFRDASPMAALGSPIAVGSPCSLASWD